MSGARACRPVTVNVLVTLTDLKLGNNYLVPMESCILATDPNIRQLVIVTLTQNGDVNPDEM